MDKQEAVQYFGGVTALADALSVGKSAISNWPDRPPYGRQLQIQFLTGGKLVADPAEKKTETPAQKKARRRAIKNKVRAAK